MPAVNGVGEPCAGEPHARFEVAGAGNGADLTKGTGVAQPTGKPAAMKAPGPTVSEPPRQSPTLLTHICAKMRDGRFWVRRITVSKRMRAKLAEVKDQLRQRRHQPVPEQGRWLGSVVRGHCAYYAVPGNRKAVAAFRTQVTRHWQAELRRRSQRSRLDWKRMNRLATRWLPPARVMHPFPDVRFGVRTRGRSPVR